MKAGESKGECLLQCDLSSLEPDKFWTILKDHRLARLKDKDDRDMSPKDRLPNSQSATCRTTCNGKALRTSYARTTASADRK